MISNTGKCLTSSTVSIANPCVHGGINVRYLTTFPMWLFFTCFLKALFLKETPSGQLGTSYAQSHSSSSGAAPEASGGGIWLPFIGYPQRVSSCATAACSTAHRLSHTDTHFMKHLGTRRWSDLLTHSDEKYPMLQKQWGKKESKFC